MPSAPAGSPVAVQSQAQAGPSTLPTRPPLAVASGSASEATPVASASFSATPQAGAPAPGNKEPHLMRIATQGKIRNYREFALRFLQVRRHRGLLLSSAGSELELTSFDPKENPSRPLVFHTLPPPTSTSAPAATRNAQVGESKARKPKAPATATIPMLVSTVENVKRAYLELYSASLVKGKGRELEVPRPLPGLWQYNETGCLEDLDEYRTRGESKRDAVDEANRAFERLKSALESKAGCVSAAAGWLSQQSVSSD
jgi:hypothetical protein